MCVWNRLKCIKYEIFNKQKYMDQTTSKRKRDCSREEEENAWYINFDVIKNNNNYNNKVSEKIHISNTYIILMCVCSIAIWSSQQYFNWNRSIWRLCETELSIKPNNNNSKRRKKHIGTSYLVMCYWHQVLRQSGAHEIRGKNSPD